MSKISGFNVLNVDGFDGHKILSTEGDTLYFERDTIGLEWLPRHIFADDFNIFFARFNQFNRYVKMFKYSRIIGK